MHVLQGQPCAPAGLAADNILQAGGFFGICGFASVDWISCELACQYLGASFRKSLVTDCLSCACGAPGRVVGQLAVQCAPTSCGIMPVRCMTARMCCTHAICSA